jgi:hypothetical protein
MHTLPKRVLVYFTLQSQGNISSRSGSSANFSGAIQWSTLFLIIPLCSRKNGNALTQV